MVTTVTTASITTGSPATSPSPNPIALAAAAARLFRAEIALHDAHQTHVDSWIAAANDRLHEALVDYLAVARCAPGAAT
ncbi:MAG: hypothetical protein DLM61_19500 [Pseudonocardiales bacterium]|nr:MAG: hypothetical protein DLM61_19500 [Pseudonocardiales bacterium]